MSKINLKELANIPPYELLEKLELDTPPFNPDAVAKKLGLKVVKHLDMESLDVSGKITPDGDKAIIWINPLDCDTRQNFTLAHEIGHFINDLLPNGSSKNTITDTPETLYRNGQSAPIERKANDFAAKLLMPKKNILEEGRKLVSQSSMGEDEFINRMADIFHVSKPAMTIRLKNLGIL